MTKKKTLKEINKEVVDKDHAAPKPLRHKCDRITGKTNLVGAINPGGPVQPKYASRANMAEEAYVSGFPRVPGAFERELYEVLEQAGEPTPKQALKALYNHSKRFAKRTLKKVEGKLRDIETKTKIALLRAAIKARRARV